MTWLGAFSQLLEIVLALLLSLALYVHRLTYWPTVWNCRLPNQVISSSSSNPAPTAPVPVHTVFLGIRLPQKYWSKPGQYPITSHRTLASVKYCTSKIRHRPYNQRKQVVDLKRKKRQGFSQNLRFSVTERTIFLITVNLCSMDGV